jgi:nucleotide-binding universal stress UspA family protein
VETRVEHGDPRDAICQMAEKLGADALVMGSHGYGLIKRCAHLNLTSKLLNNM